MNKLKSLLAAAVTAFACVVTADTAPTSFWWHFNGADGEAAPTTLSDTTGNYTLTLQQYGSGTLTTQESQSESQGRIAYWQTGEGLAVDDDVAGAVQMYRFDANGKYKASRYMLDDAQTRAVLPVNAAGDIKSFTLEMVYKCDPWDADLGGTAKNLTFATIRRRWGKNTVGNVMNVCGLNGGDLYVQGSGANESTGLKVVNNRFIVGSDSYRDGKWHHLAVVYSLDESKTPHQGTIALYLDYQSKGSVNCKLVDESNRAGLIYQPSSDLSTETTAELSFGEIGVNYRSSMVLDEVRVTQAALDVEELFRIGPRDAFRRPGGNLIGVLERGGNLDRNLAVGLDLPRKLRLGLLRNVRRKNLAQRLAPQLLPPVLLLSYACCLPRPRLPRLPVEDAILQIVPVVRIALYHIRRRPNRLRNVLFVRQQHPVRLNHLLQRRPQSFNRTIRQSNNVPPLLRRKCVAIALPRPPLDLPVVPRHRRVEGEGDERLCRLACHGDIRHHVRAALASSLQGVLLLRPDGRKNRNRRDDLAGLLVLL